MASFPHAPSEDVDAVNILKRRCEVLEEQLAHANRPKPRNITHAQIHAGRPVRRVVSLFDSVEELVEENDRRLLLELEPQEDRANIQHTIEQDHLYHGYQLLFLHVPSIKEALVQGDSDELRSFYKNIRTGSDRARGDDAASLKTVIVQWIDNFFGVSVPPLQPKYKERRGLDNDYCGQLLCPAEFDWSDYSIRAKIRDGDPIYAVTARSWPVFLYTRFEVHAEDMERGLFRSELLIKAYKHIFTSPTSATIDDQNAELNHQPIKRRRTGVTYKKSAVASIIKLRSVTPRSIAYIAVQVRFALSSMNFWNKNDVDFNYREFYYAVIDYFEAPPGPVAKHSTTELLHWWNKRVFGKANRSVQRAETGPISSMSMMATQWAAKERDVLDELD